MKKKKKKYIFVVQRIRQKKPSIKKNQELLSWFILSSRQKCELDFFMRWKCVVF